MPIRTETDIMSSARIFIVGCGDIGCRVGALELQAGSCVAALARSEIAAAALHARGFEVMRGDLDAPGVTHRLPGRSSVLYYFAPPPGSGTEDRRLGSFLAALTARHEPERCVYISTSGVYGDCGGAWITEDRVPHPITDRARRRLDAEAQWQAWCRQRGIDLVVLRVPGIYGPGRLPIERIRSGTPVLREEESPFSNRIHADDLASICVLAARGSSAKVIFNVSDGHPTTMTDYFYRVADLLGMPRPPAIGLEEARQLLSPGMLSFLAESKRLDNRLVLTELRVRLRYPDLASGLPSCIPSA